MQIEQPIPCHLAIDQSACVMRSYSPCPEKVTSVIFSALLREKNTKVCIFKMSDIVTMFPVAASASNSKYFVQLWPSASLLLVYPFCFWSSSLSCWIAQMLVIDERQPKQTGSLTSQMLYGIIYWIACWKKVCKISTH